MELLDIGRLLRSGWLLIGSALLLGVLGGAVYALLQQPVYAATSRVFVGTPSTNDLDTLSVGASFSQQIVSSYSTVVTDPIVLEPVIDRLGLHTTAAQLADHVSATVPDGTLVIDITVDDRSPVEAARIANAVSTSLVSAVDTITPGSSGSSAPVTITTTREATAPTAPASPNRPLDIVFGAMAGIVLGLVLAVVRGLTDTRIRSTADVRRVVDAPLLGGIVTTPTIAGGRVVSVDDARSASGEAYRLLRTNLQFLDPTSARRTFVITSPHAGEGKTTTATNLAAALAQGGEAVVLVDADLRRPQVSEVLDLGGELGLTDVLIGAVGLDDALQTWRASGLTVLPAGRIPPNPVELLQSREMVEVLELLGQRFTTVLLDSPPIVPVADAAVLAARSSGAILVVAEGSTRRPELEKAALRLEQVGADLLGVVMNFERPRRHHGYGYGYAPDRAPTAADQSDLTLGRAGLDGSH